MRKYRLTEEDYAAAVAVKPRTSPRVREAVRMVLVDGLTQTGAAKKQGMTRQQVNQACNEIFKQHLLLVGCPDKNVIIRACVPREHEKDLVAWIQQNEGWIC